MEIRGIDVSAWQGKIDWKTVADYGMGFAILRITEAGNEIATLSRTSLNAGNTISRLGHISIPML